MLKFAKFFIALTSSCLGGTLPASLAMNPSNQVVDAAAVDAGHLQRLNRASFPVGPTSDILNTNASWTKISASSISTPPTTQADGSTPRSPIIPIQDTSPQAESERLSMSGRSLLRRANDAGLRLTEIYLSQHLSQSVSSGQLAHQGLVNRNAPDDGANPGGESDHEGNEDEGVNQTQHPVDESKSDDDASHDDADDGIFEIEL